MTTSLFIRTLAYFVKGKTRRKEKKKSFIGLKQGWQREIFYCYVTSGSKKNKLFVFYITKIEIAFGSGNFRLWEGVCAKQTFLSF